MNESDRRRRRRKRKDLPISEEIARDMVEKYPAVKTMLEKFNLSVE